MADSAHLYLHGKRCIAPPCYQTDEEGEKERLTLSVKGIVARRAVRR